MVPSKNDLEISNNAEDERHKPFELTVSILGYSPGNKSHRCRKMFTAPIFHDHKNIVQSKTQAKGYS